MFNKFYCCFIFYCVVVLSINTVNKHRCEYDPNTEILFPCLFVNDRAGRTLQSLYALLQLSFYIDEDIGPAPTL